MITVRELEAEFAADAELDLDEEFICVEPVETRGLYDLKRARREVLRRFYVQDATEEGWHGQEPWASEMPHYPIPMGERVGVIIPTDSTMRCMEEEAYMEQNHEPEAA